MSLKTILHVYLNNFRLLYVSPFYKITIGIGEKILNLKIRIFNFFFPFLSNITVWYLFDFFIDYEMPYFPNF